MKFESVDKDYLSRRKEVSEKYGPRELWSVIDHWPLYCGVANLSRFLAIMDLVQKSLEVPGHLAEFGSWRGANLMFMAKLLRINDPHGSKQVYCFDSFEGLSEFTKEDGQAVQMRDKYKGSYQELVDLINLYQMQDDIVIHKGLIEKTLPGVLEKNPQLTFSLVYCDTDLYQSTQLALESLHDRLSVGGFFVFDEWNDDLYPGEGVAANQFMQKFPGCYEPKSVLKARQPTLVLKKVR